MWETEKSIKKKLLCMEGGNLNSVDGFLYCILFFKAYIF